MAKLSVLHISDIHIGNTYRNDVNDIAIHIVEALEDHDRGVDCVVVTGDIFDGKFIGDNRIEKALDFFNYLKCELHLSQNDFVFVPGNHDLIRKEDTADFSDYKSFLSGFYGIESYTKDIDQEFLFCIRAYEEKKVAILGLNSCMLKSYAAGNRDLKWLEEIEIDEDIKQKIKTVVINQKKSEWDDYGYISKSQLRKAFKQLEEQLHDLSNYTVVVCFHHHFYPFPEIYSRYGDSSIIRNFTDVIEKFQQKNVKVVLHGHKHLPIIRPLTNYKYLTDPDSIFYVLSAGSVGKKDIDNRSFQQIDIYSPNSPRVADICQFNYKIEELQTPVLYSIPPKKIYEQNAFVEIYNLFREEYPDEFEVYRKEIYECDNISQQNRIDDIIKNLSQIVTQFDSIKKGLKKNCNNILVFLYSIHYRINHLTIKNSKDRHQRTMLKTIKNKLVDMLKDDSYVEVILSMLESGNSRTFEKTHDELFSKYTRFNDYTSYIAVALFFTDLYLTFVKYGEVYFNTEKLKHKVNIKLEADSFHDNIPVTTIKLTSDVDRRQAIISFKCKNPTVHKIGVLIVKDYEQRINRMEDSFKHLGLKIYYISPKVEKDNYNLENLNFEAYIPTLLPLLTGENLYKNREVFSRELIQNSLDAILLRNKLLLKLGKSLTEEEKCIHVELGVCKHPQNGKERKYLRIVDNGIGMDSFKIERYFTSIGRSFYKSDEFEELQKNESIQYNPISNFGIGFLSAFMVASEIEVLTKSFESPEYALEIHIPNYEGCFFIRKIEDKDNDLKIGTTITLYEDDRKYLNFDDIVTYIKETFVDFQLDIEIEEKEKQKTEVVKSFSARRGEKNVLFCPIVDDKIKRISWKKEIQSGNFIDAYNYGILVEFESFFQKEYTLKYSNFLNSGIKLTGSNMNINFKVTPFSRCFYNFPSSFVNLDVARENILSLKSSIPLNEVVDVLAEQGLDLIHDITLNNKNFPLKIIDNIILFFNANGIKPHLRKEYYREMYILNLDSTNCIKLKKGVDVSCIGYTKDDLKNMIRIYHNILAKFVDKGLKIENFEEYAEWYTALCNLTIDEFAKKEKLEFIGLKNYPDLRDKLDLVIHKNIMKESNFGLKLNLGNLTVEKIFDYYDDEFQRLIHHKYPYFTRDILESGNYNESVFRFEDSEEMLGRFFGKALSRQKSIKKWSSKKGTSAENTYYDLLSYWILSDFVYQLRRRKGEYINIVNIIAIFNLLAEYVSRTVSIPDAIDFKIEV